MTLDSLTRSQAEANHFRLKNSLSEAATEFRSRFKNEPDLFRSLPASPTRYAAGINTPTTNTITFTTADDLVRAERIRQCCKRVRIWKRQIANPLLQFKHHQQAAGGKKSDRRMHITLLTALIVDIYDQHIQFEAEQDGELSGNTPPLGIQESFPEFVVRFITQRASNRRVAADQLHSTVSTVLQTTAAHHRVRLFGTLCGLDDSIGTNVNNSGKSFHPPEQIKVFVRIVERLHRWKATNMPTSRLEESTTSVADIVFYNIGITQHVVQKVIVELFQEDYYWNFQFWHTQCLELGVDSKWPLGSCEQLQERVLNLAVSSRNAFLTNTRKIDGDAFLALLVDTWTERAYTVSNLLEKATDAEEGRGCAVLQQRQQLQDRRTQHLPLIPTEIEFFNQLVDEFWNAPIPWSSASIQLRMTSIEHVRPLSELMQLYKEFVVQLDDANKPWQWIQWPWETDWEWGALIVTE